MLVAETPRLVIRHLSANDADAMEAIFCDPEVMRYSEDGVQTPEFVRVWVANMISYDPVWGLGIWALIEKVTRDLIGYVGLSRFPNRCGPHETELGFRLARPYWGRGYATEAARGACDYALHRLLLPRIIAMIDPDNVASVRVVEKIGMTRESEIMFRGYTHPDHLYAIRQ